MAESHIVNITGGAREILFPNLCARCGAPAARAVRIECAFETGKNENRTWDIVRFAPQFCDACIAQHVLEAQPVSFTRRLELMVKTWYALGIAGSAVAICVVLTVAAKRMAEEGMNGALAPLLFAALIAVLLAWCVMEAWWTTRHRAIVPPTSVTSAVDFTRDLSSVFEPSWRRFTFQNEAYAQAFTAANRAILWDSHGTTAQRAASLRFDTRVIVILIVAATAIFVAIQYWVRPQLGL